MTQWLLIRRLRGPAFLLLIGIMATLHVWTNFGFERSWPLLLILGGLFALAERGALAQADLDAYDPITGQPRSPETAYRVPGASITPAAPAPVQGSDSGVGRP